MNRWGFLLIGATIGAILGTTHIIAPIHEFYHAIVALDHGVPAHVTSWITTEIAAYNFPAVFAGWSAGLWFAAVWAVVFAFIGRNSKAYMFTGAGGLAFAAAQWIRGYTSADFTNTVQDYINLQNMSQDDKSQAWSIVHQAINQRWTTLGVLILVGTAIIVLVLLARDKRNLIWKGGEAQ